MPHVTGLDLPFPFYAVTAFIFGLIIGSFLNVVIHRVPRGMSVVFPRSHCASCAAPVAAFDNIPLVSFALLGGRCRSCRARISAAYPTVELGAGLMFTALMLKTGPSWELLLEFAFASVIIALVFIDARHHLLPNVITYPAFIFALASATAQAGWSDKTLLTFDISFVIPGLRSAFMPWRAALFGALLFALAAPGFLLLDRLDALLFSGYFDWAENDEEIDEKEIEKEIEIERRHNRAIRATMIFGVVVAVAWAALVVLFSAKHQQAFEAAYNGLTRASFGALIIGGLIWLIRAAYFLLRRIEGMGLGDVKMMAVVAAFLSWHVALGVLLLGSIIGSVIGVIFFFRSKQGFKAPLPFGACLGIAALIVMLTATPFSVWHINQ